MNKRDVYAQGYSEGYGIVESNHVEFRDMDKDEILSEVGEIESNARQFSPFEFFAADINRSRNPDALWEAYDSGVYAGAKAAIKKLRLG